MKKFFVALMLWAFTPGVSLVWGEVDEAAAGLLGYWPMDEGAGTLVAPLIGNVPSGQLTNGTLWGAGIAGSGLNFDGVDDHVVLGKVTGVPHGQNFSVSIFVKPQGKGRSQQIYWEGESRTHFNLSLTGDNRIRVSSRAELELGAENTSPVSVGEWSHVVVTFENFANEREIKFFINGELTDTARVTGELYLADGRAFLGAMGRIDVSNAMTLTSFFNGEMDDLRFYNRALNLTEVRELQQKNSRPDQTPAVLSSLSPTGPVPAFTFSVLLSLVTNEKADCRFATTPNTPFTLLPETFTSRFGGTIHEAEVSHLPNGQLYTAYVRCRDEAGNENQNDAEISFSLLSPAPPPVSLGVGRVFFMATDGNDGSPGTVTMPFKTFSKAASVLAAGDTLYVRAGIYNQMLTDGVNSGQDWASPIIYKAYPGERPILRPAILNDVVRFNQNAYVVVDGFVLDGAQLLEPELPVVKITSNAHHIRVINCEIKNSLNGHGIQTSGPRGDYVEIINNDIHDNGNVAVGTQNHGLYLETPNCLIENNRFYRNNVWHIHGFSGNSDNTVVRGNIFHDSDSGAILISNGSNWLVSNNVITNAGRGTGIEMRGYSAISGVKVLNNTIYDCAFGLFLGEGNAGIHNVTIANNIVFQNNSGGLHISELSTATHVQNNLISQSPSYSGTSIRDLGLGTIYSTNKIDGNITPQFVNAVHGDFHLQPTSDALDAGINRTEVGTDFVGVARPQGLAWDMGAFERLGNKPPPNSAPVDSIEENHFPVLSTPVHSIFNPTRGEKIAVGTFLHGEPGPIEILDRQGKPIKTLYDAGPQTEWNGLNQNGALVASGIYLVKFPKGQKKIVVVK